MIQWYLVAALAFGGAVSGAYFWGRLDGAAIERSEQAAFSERLRKVKEEAMAGAAAEIAQIEVTHTTIRQELAHEILNNDVYRDCHHGPAGLHLVNQALTGEQSSGDSQLSGTDPAH